MYQSENVGGHVVDMKLMYSIHARSTYNDFHSHRKRSQIDLIESLVECAKRTYRFRMDMGSNGQNILSLTPVTVWKS